MSPPKPERHSMESTSIRLPTNEFRKSIRKPAVSYPQSQRQEMEGTPASRGPKEPYGSGSFEHGRSIRLIPTREKSFALLNPIALSPVLPGWRDICGMPPGRETKAISGESILKREKCSKV